VTPNILDLQAKYNSYPRVHWCVIEGKIERRIETREDEQEDVSTSWMIFRKGGHWKFERERIRSHSAENSLWKRLRTFRKTDYGWVLVVNINVKSSNLVFLSNMTLKMKFALHPW
jgi:N-acetyl-anhydromuramyl-L-alanine amidase AmpD